MSKVNSTSQNAINAEKVNFDSLKNDRLNTLRGSALSSARRIGKVNKQMPEEMEHTREHLSAVAALFLCAKDAFHEGDESLGDVFNAVAGIEIIRASIAASEAIESEDVKPNALPLEFIELCEEYGASPVTLFGDGADPSELRAVLYDEYFLDIRTLFDRDGRPGATLLQVSSGISFERAFNHGIVAYSGGKSYPLFGTAAEVIGEVIDDVEEWSAL